MPKKIPEQTKDHAIRLMLDHLDEYDNMTAACESVVKKTGVGKESLRRLIRQAQVDVGQWQGATTSDSEQLMALKRENRELREANEILKAATIFFARELGACQMVCVSGRS